MIKNPRIVIFSLIAVFVCGLMVSYKSFQIGEKDRVSVQEQQVEKSLNFASQLLEEKLKTLEASVSYLDNSTVETLKRMGARYFAYAFQDGTEWQIKYKVIGELKKDGILSEARPLPFATFAKTRRHWRQNNKGEPILIVPVKLAKATQLQKGYLIFGLNPDFFSAVGKVDPNLVLISKKGAALYRELPENSPAIGAIINEAGRTLSFEDHGETRFFNRFSRFSQINMITPQTIVATAFIQSPYFNGFLIGGVLAALLLLVIASRVSESVSINLPSLGRTAEASAPSIADEIIAEAHNAPLTPTHSSTATITDLSTFIDGILEDERDRLKTMGIEIKVNISEGLEVLASGNHIADFLKRLIGNSVLALDTEDEKRIEISAVEQSDSYQLMYLDSRRSSLPSREEGSLLLHNEASMDGIDGIVAYANWLFGERFTIAKKGFCLSVDLEKPMINQPRIEISDADTDPDIADAFTNLETVTLDAAGSEAERVMDNMAEIEQEPSIEDILSQFQLKDLDFEDSNETATEDSADLPVADNNGMFEIETNDFKIKIRSPRKRDKDVDC